MPESIVIHFSDKRISDIFLKNHLLLEDIQTIVCIRTGISKEYQIITYDDGRIFNGIIVNAIGDPIVYKINVTYKDNYRYGPLYYGKHKAIHLYNNPDIINMVCGFINEAIKLIDRSFLIEYLTKLHVRKEIHDEINLLQLLIENNEHVSIDYILSIITVPKEEKNYVLYSSIKSSSYDLFESVMEKIYTKEHQDQLNAFLLRFLFGRPLSNSIQKFTYIISLSTIIIPDLYLYDKEDDSKPENMPIINIVVHQVYKLHKSRDTIQDTETYMIEFIKQMAKRYPLLLIVPYKTPFFHTIASLHTQDNLFYTICEELEVKVELELEVTKQIIFSKNSKDENILFFIRKKDRFEKIIQLYERYGQNPLEVNDKGNTFYMDSLEKSDVLLFQLEYICNYKCLETKMIKNINDDTFFHLLYKNNLTPTSADDKIEEYILDHWACFNPSRYLNEINKVGRTPIYIFMFATYNSNSILNHILIYKSTINIHITYKDQKTIFFAPFVNLFTLLTAYPDIDYLYQLQDGTTILIHIFKTFVFNLATKSLNEKVTKLFSHNTKDDTNLSFIRSLDIVDASGNTPFHYLCMKSPNVYNKMAKEYNDMIECFKMVMENYSCEFSQIKNKEGKTPVELTKYKLIHEYFGSLSIPRPNLIKNTMQHTPIVKARSNESNVLFTIISWNMFNGRCLQKSEINDILPYSDVIVTQENDSSVFMMPGLSCGKDSEKVGLYTRSVVPKDDVLCIGTTPSVELDSSNIKQRNGYITMINGIKIANLHLEGGRYADKLLFSKERENILQYKLDLLLLLIKHDPQIISGDFNSVYHPDSGTLLHYLDIQIIYFNELKIKELKSELTAEDKDFIFKWNLIPYRLLSESGYQYAIPKNTESFTSQLGHTRVDSIWFKGLTLYDCYILPLPFTKYTFCISDHNPVIASFFIKESPIVNQENASFILEDSSLCNSKPIVCDADCKERLRLGPIVQAFHATTEDIAIKIWNSGQLICGNKGTQGPGIYLCPRPLDCFYKASFRDKKFTFLFEVDVLMGNSIIETDEKNQPDLSIYDSVIYKRDSGLEYVVYRPFQIIIRSMYRVLTRNIKEITFSYSQSREESFSNMNAYLLGGWSYKRKLSEITSIHDIGPYDLDQVRDRVSDCKDDTEILCNDRKTTTFESYREMSNTGKMNRKKNKSRRNKSKRNKSRRNKSKYNKGRMSKKKVKL